MKRPRCLLGTETVKAGSHRAAATSEVRQSLSIASRCSLTATLRNLLRMGSGWFKAHTLDGRSIP